MSLNNLTKVNDLCHQRTTIRSTFFAEERTENADIDLTLHIDLDEGKDREIRSRLVMRRAVPRFSSKKTTSTSKA